MKRRGSNKGLGEPKAPKAPKKAASSKSVDAGSVWAEQAGECLATVDTFRKWLHLWLQ